jgi:hypothetical protein
VPRDKPRVPSGSAPPPDFPVTTPLSSGDYSFLEIVMAMQGSIFQLKEAVEGLKANSKSHGEKLESLGKDVHAAKVVVGLVGGFVGLVGIFLGIVLKALLDYLLRTP